MKRSSTKGALYTSFISLVLCCTMLLGTTFAWFTDEVTSTNNIIRSGSLDVEFYYQVEGQTDWTEIFEGSNIFKENALWEPGYTEVVKLKAVNAGDLALKYQLGVAVASETGSINKEGKNFKLSDYIMYGVVDGDNDFTRETAVAAVKDTATALKKGYVKYGTLLASEDGEEVSDIVTLVVYMPETTGNEANHRKDAVKPEIKLGVSILATQLTAEIDSFDDQYDKDAIFTDFIVTNEEELKAALAKASEGAVIGIKGNVTWTTGAEHGSTPFVEATEEKMPVKNLTIVGLENNPTFTAIGEGVGPIGIDDGTVTFKNLKIVDESVSYAENSWEFGYLEFRGNTIFENCEFVNAIAMDGDSAEFTNCSFNSNKDSEYAVWVSGGTAKFEDCFFTGSRGVKMHEAYGSDVESVVINNSKFVDLTKKPGVAIGTVNADTTVVITNNEFIGTQAGDQGLYIYETDTDVTTFKFTEENNKVVGDEGEDLPDGLFKDAEGNYYATTANGLKQGVIKADAGSTVYLYNDIDFGTAQLNVEKAIVIDLNDNDFSTNNARPIRLTNGASIKNGTINVTTTVAAIVVQGNEKIGSIEDITLNVTTPEGKTTTGIQLYDNKHADAIRNVTITGVTQGIEVANGSSVGVIENVKVDAERTGLQVQQSTIGEIIDSEFYGKTNGVWAQLKGTNDLDLTFVNSTLTGGTYGMYVCDEGADIVPTGSAYINYDEKTVFDGKTEDIEYAFGQSGKLVINGVREINNEEALKAGISKGETVVMTQKISMESAQTAPYGNKYAVKLDGGVIDGGNNELYMECYGDDYGIMTSGGTVKNITIKEGCRAVMLMYPTEDVILDNVNIGGDGVLYPINTGEAGAEGVDLIVTNSTLAGWTSYSNINSASFTNVEFKQGTYYNNIYGRVLKPYVNTTITDCKFVEHMNLDLSGLAQGQTITISDSTVNGQDITLDTFTIPTNDDQYDTALFTIDLPSWATSVSDCVVINNN